MSERKKALGRLCHTRIMGRGLRKLGWLRGTTVVDGATIVYRRAIDRQSTAAFVDGGTRLKNQIMIESQIKNLPYPQYH